ncbi:MAG: hypothetical protein LBQ25_06450 [Azonexus sp.]|jgi:hypothetical protein|nr:hypothetical protein [Azonexus sp.]
MSPLPLLLLALLLPAAPALAKGAGNESGYTEDLDRRCQVWAPSMLTPYDHALRYSGGCRDGKAEGQGKAEWLYRYADMKVKAAWEGEFRNGVFLDGQKIKGTVEPLPGDRYVIAMGQSGGTNLHFISRSRQDGPPVLCQVELVALQPNGKVDLSDDDAARQLLEAGARTYLAACPKITRSPDIGIFDQALQPRANGMLPNPVVRARYDSESGKLNGYSNEPARQAQQARQQAEHAEKQAAARQRFMDLSRQYGVATWITPRQLDENPFRWEGRTVGLIVRLERMLTRDTALVRGTQRDYWWAPLQLTGVNPDFPDSKRSVLLVARVGKRERSADGRDEEANYLTVQHVAHRLCERDGCADWLLWWRGDNDELVWGEPFTAR